MAKSIDKELDDLESAITAVRLSYEKYFAGIDRVEPMREREKVKSFLRRLRAEPTQNTARKFRLQQAQARMNSLEQHWNRITRQIEEGTYKRDLRKAQRRSTAPARRTPAAGATDAGSNNYSDDLKKLHADYVAVQNQSGAKSKVSIDSLAKTVAKQKEAIKAKLNCKDVEFKVSVKEGRPILKAIPKK